jgi:hypothetical protein
VNETVFRRTSNPHPQPHLERVQREYEPARLPRGRQPALAHDQQQRHQHVVARRRRRRDAGGGVVIVLVQLLGFVWGVVFWGVSRFWAPRLFLGGVVL